jgi:hypothetical protein
MNAIFASALAGFFFAGTLPSPQCDASGAQDLHRQIPNATVDSHVLRNGRDRTRTNEPFRHGSAAQALAKEIFLNSIRDPPEIVPNVLRPPAGEQLRRLESQCDRPVEFAPLSGSEESLAAQIEHTETFRHLESTHHDLVHDIAPVTHTAWERRFARRTDRWCRRPERSRCAVDKHSCRRGYSRRESPTRNR